MTSTAWQRTALPHALHVADGAVKSHKCEKGTGVDDNSDNIASFAAGECLGTARPPNAGASQAATTNELGHDLFRCGGLAWRSRCGCWRGVSGGRKLLERCRGAPSAPLQLEWLKQGLHPLTKAPLGLACGI